jgi:DNA-binding IclR family transcriptional regulator
MKGRLSMRNKPPQKKYQANTLERGLELLDALAVEPLEKTLTELSVQAGFNLATTHRIINVLNSMGYVRKNASSSKYRLGLKLFELGQKAISELNLCEEAIPILKSLANKTGETVYLFIIDNGKALCLERIEGFHLIKSLAVRQGDRAPLHVGAAPRVLLAYLPADEIDKIIKEIELPKLAKNTVTGPDMLRAQLKEIRQHGYALGMENFTDGAAAVGCPVMDWKGEVLASISISGIFTHFKGANLKEYISDVQSAANELSEKLQP